MKTIRLLLAAMVLSTTVASAQNYGSEGATSNVMIIGSSVCEDPEIYEYSTPEEVKEHIRAKNREDRRMKFNATERLKASAHIDEFQGTEAPMMIISQKDNKFAFAFGGFINLRTSYDFDGVTKNIDFVTYDIPISSTYATRQQLMMDASTSRIFFQGVANSRALGQIDVYVDMDFRGDVGYDDEGITNSYLPRLRRAYVSFLGFTIGRDVTTFSDLAAAPTTIDFQGPNAYVFNYATLLRYTYSGCNDRLEFAVALEQPNISGTYGDDGEFEAIPQRVPDVPAYIEYKMGKNREHHIRASGVIRDMYLYDVSKDKNTTLLGWGAQLSGNLMPFKWLDLRFNGTYGEGITPYIQDLIGSGLDFTPNPLSATNVQTMPMYAWQAAACLNFTDRFSMNGGYSTVNIEKRNGYYADDEYKKGEYIFGNLFYDVTPRLKIAGEYIYGSRKNMDNTSNHANRASLMAQFSF